MMTTDGWKPSPDNTYEEAQVEETQAPESPSPEADQADAGPDETE